MHHTNSEPAMLCRTKYCVISIVLLVLLPAFSFCQNSRRQLPNILFILSDDHSAPHLSCYGDPNLHTPNIDAIAQHGVRFTRMYIGTPQCVPSRATLMTGRSEERRVGKEWVSKGRTRWS